MLFNSVIYIFIFVPLTFIFYFVLNRYHLILAGEVVLVLASIFFYSYWNPAYLPLIIVSILFNYAVGNALSSKKLLRKEHISAKMLLIFGCIVNFAFLGYFKYFDFLIYNLNAIAGTDFPFFNIVLPLAISFFTFQQVAYLVDSYQGKTEEYNFLNYCLFVTFFPQLIAGPIVHHKEIMPQLEKLRNKLLSHKNVSKGLFIFFMGLFKKTVIADTLSVYANKGYAIAEEITFFDAWMSTSAYTFQLYFDFSGYTDMAIGSALLFNIALPLNFNSPYKALSIQDFWRRWHMTLSRWLRDYLYIPLGGNRKGPVRTYVNLFVTFLLGGLWHGAGWTFVIWGAMHGFANSVQKMWSGWNIKMPKVLGWFITFTFVHFTWIFFRAPSFDSATGMLRGVLGINGVVLPARFENSLSFLTQYGFSFRGVTKLDFTLIPIFFVVISALIAIFAKNSIELKDRFKPNLSWAVFAGMLAAISLFSLTKVSEFLYFQF